MADLEGLELKPREGQVLVRFVDDDDDQASPPSSSPEPMEYEGVLALVVSVGAKVSGCKAGDTVVCDPWARNGLKVGRNRIVSDWEIESDSHEVTATK